MIVDRLRVLVLVVLSQKRAGSGWILYSLDHRLKCQIFVLKELVDYSLHRGDTQAGGPYLTMDNEHWTRWIETGRLRRTRRPAYSSGNTIIGQY